MSDAPEQEHVLELLREIRSLEGRALREVSTLRDPIALFVSHLEEVRAAVEQDGVWEHDDEWRISTTGARRIERRRDAYAVTTTAHGEFAAAFRTFPEAYEAMSALWALQIGLFYAIGWASWPARRKLDRPRNDVERYLQRLSKDARARGSAATPGSIRPERVDWNDAGVAYRVTVENGSLRMSDLAADPPRAAEFAGVYARLQADLLRILKWEPL